jgi:hypothetical protein
MIGSKEDSATELQVVTDPLTGTTSLIANITSCNGPFALVKTISLKTQ